MNEKISVALASYNGQEYIKQQVETILANLKPQDELIISDDGSTDNTIQVIQEISDSRIKIINGPKKGVIANFENAIRKCSGDYIFLADQDDIWEANKVSKVLETFHHENCQCIVHDALVVNGDATKVVLDSFFDFRKSKSGFLKNILKNSYIGCCMAFTSNMKQYILPIPTDMGKVYHDQWIGLICEKHGKPVFIKDKLIKYRRHDNNQSNMHRYSIKEMLQNRFYLIKKLSKR